MKIEITYKVNEDATFDVLFNDVKIGIIEKTNSWYFRCNKKLNVDKYFLSVIVFEELKKKDFFEAFRYLHKLKFKKTNY